MLELPSCHPLRSTKAGFALVISLSLMAFVVLLLLSITTLVRVETSAAKTALSRVEAEQNALLGVYVALGDLQRGLGPDQRVTARADILDTDPKSLESNGVVNPYWLAAYKSVQPGSETQSLEGLRTWSTDQSAQDRVDWFVSARTDLSLAGVTPATTDVLALNGGDASKVVTLAQYKDNEDVQVDVNAGKLDIVNRTDSVEGRYAWWVTDENAKFQINAIKDDEVLDGQPFESRWSLMAPHQSNLAVISELSSFDVNDTLQKDKMARVFSSKSLQLLDPSWDTWLSENRDDFTIAAQSIPVDVTQGRLKQDLSVYLGSDSSGLSDSDFIVRGSSTDPDYVGQLSGSAFQLDHISSKLPQFGLLKSWYESGMQVSGFDQGVAPEPRAQTTMQSGLHPVILRGAVHIGISFNAYADGIKPVYLVFPKFVLWNPHNVPIAPAKYIIQVRAHTTLNTQINVDGRDYAAWNTTQDFGYTGPGPFKNPQGDDTFSHSNLSIALKNRDRNNEYPNFTFVIDTQGFAPGETLYFTAEDNHQNTDAEYFDIPTYDINDSNFEEANLLVNEDEGGYGFFYFNEGGFMMKPVTPVGDAVPVTGQDDRLETSIYFRNTTSPDKPEGKSEPSLTSKLYRYSSGGDVALLQTLDFSADSSGDTLIDWEHINSAENVKQHSEDSEWDPLNQTVLYHSLDYYRADQGTAIPFRGHGYYISPMAGASDPNQSRMLARQNFAVDVISMADPLVSDLETGRVYSDAYPTEDWFNDGTKFPSEIPTEMAYSAVTADGYDRLGGFGLYSNSEDVSPGTVYPLYDRVRAETGLFSIGFLKNVNFSQFHWQPTFTLGNSEAHTHVDRDQIKTSHGGTVYTDLSYLLNESLFDRFYLSTIPQVGDFTPASDLILPNTRNRIVANADGSFKSAAALRDSKQAFDESAANIVIEGGFNVNSTSLDAWRMLLASYLGERVLAADGAASNPIGNSPLTSRLYPLLPEASSVDPSSPEAWSALRSLTTDEIDLLATAIVEEVKRRGPFLSLGDFINRRLVADSNTVEGDYLGLKGTLQAAIDKLSVANTDQLNNAYYQDSYAASPTKVPDNSEDKEHETGMPGGLDGSRLFGVPGFLTQGDLLSALAPVLTVRGDTFTIRSYGESLSPISGDTESEAWCEAVVQRIASPVEDGDSIIAPTGAFGRSFKIISIRWFGEADLI
ncbi:hypothetical protein ACWPKO_12505 [Coraliomargarita sp. W4R53]